MTGRPERASNTFSRVIFYIKNVTPLEGELVAKKRKWNFSVGFDCINLTKNLTKASTGKMTVVI